MLRVSHRGEGIDDAETVEGAREIVRDQPAGRYDVDEIRAEPLPSGHTSRGWVHLIRHPDGRIEDEPHPGGRVDDDPNPHAHRHGLVEMRIRPALRDGEFVAP
jgi:hypothetical protein